MRIRIFQAFASNNSGSYTIVGAFGSTDAAEAAAAALTAICAEHHAWYSKKEAERSATAPLDTFARAHGLAEERPGRDDEWPQYGEPPVALATGLQVVLHAPYTVTIPRIFGEYIYKRGGRVDVELVHTHEDLLVHVELYIVGARPGEAAHDATMAALKAELEALLPDLTARRPHDDRPVVPPLFRRSSWGALQLLAVFEDVLAGVGAVRAAASARGVLLHVRIRESDEGLVDPFAQVRTLGDTSGGT